MFTFFFMFTGLPFPLVTVSWPSTLRNRSCFSSQFQGYPWIVAFVIVSVSLLLAFVLLKCTRKMHAVFSLTLRPNVIHLLCFRKFCNSSDFFFLVFRTSSYGLFLAVWLVFIFCASVPLAGSSGGFEEFLTKVWWNLGEILPRHVSCWRFSISPSVRTAHCTYCQCIKPINK